MGTNRKQPFGYTMEFGHIVVHAQEAKWVMHFFLKYNQGASFKELAEMMQENLIEGLDSDHNRSSKKADGIYLLQHVDCPAVLIECGFLSNPEEERKLREESYQKKLCCVIGVTVGRFLTK